VPAASNNGPAGLSKVAWGIVITAALWGAFTIFPALRLVVFVTFLSVLGATVVSHPIGWLARHMPRGLAVAVTFGALVGLGVGLVLLVAPFVARQASEILEQIPAAIDSVAQWWRNHVTPATGAPPPRRKLVEDLTGLLGKVAPVAFSTLSALSAALLVLVLSFFLAYDPDAYLRGVLTFVPPRHRRTIEGYFRRLGLTLRNWLVGTLVSMTLIGTLISLGLLLLGIEGWAALGLLAFFGEFVPFLGPVLTAVPAVAVALGESPLKALYVAAMYLAVQQIEGNLVQPLVMRRAVSLEPALLLVWQILMTGAFGLMGLIVATPLLACLKVSVEFFYVERALSTTQRTPTPE